MSLVVCDCLMAVRRTGPWGHGCPVAEPPDRVQSAIRMAALRSPFLSSRVSAQVLLQTVFTQERKSGMAAGLGSLIYRGKLPSISVRGCLQWDAWHTRSLPEVANVILLAHLSWLMGAPDSPADTASVHLQLVWQRSMFAHFISLRRRSQLYRIGF